MTFFAHKTVFNSSYFVNVEENKGVRVEAVLFDLFDTLLLLESDEVYYVPRAVLIKRRPVVENVYAKPDRIIIRLRELLAALDDF